jgi:HAD superfamily hydrolase (TIGR01484 family)
LTRESPQAAIEALSKVERVYLDLDGTTVTEGAVSLPPGALDAFRMLRDVGVSICLGPTGKPLAEVEPLLVSIPQDIQVDVLFEKGAYRSHSTTRGAERFLVTLADEALMSSLRASFYSRVELNESDGIAGAIEQEFGVGIVPAGSGEHQALISFDLVSLESGRLPSCEDAATRRSRKIFDTHISAAIAARLRALLQSMARIDSSAVDIVDLKNGNIELAPRGVGKAEAIRRDLESRGSLNIALAGDSYNDAEMLGLATQMGNVQGCLVLFRESSVPLTQLVQCVVFGEANVARYLEVIVAARLGAAFAFKPADRTCG